MTFASATFTGTAFTELSAVDSAFSKQSGYSFDLILGSTGAYLIRNGIDLSAYQHSATPPSADYAVQATIAKLSGATDPDLAVCGRMADGEDTYYFLQYSHSIGSVRLFKRVGGSSTQLGSSYSLTLTGTPVSIRLEMSGNQISGYVNGTLQIGPVTDTAITAAGKAGLRLGNSRQTGVADSASYDDWFAEILGDSLYGFDLQDIIFGNLVGSPVGIGTYPATEMHMQVRAVGLAGTIIATDTVTTDGDAKLARWTDASITLGTWYRIDLATTETDPGDRSTFSVLMQAT